MRRRMTYTVEYDREDDGRWIADVPALPGCLAYGRTRAQALARIRKLASSVLIDLLAHHESVPTDYGTTTVKLAI